MSVFAFETVLQFNDAIDAYQFSFELASMHTNRKKLLIITDASKANPYTGLNETHYHEMVVAGDAAALCTAIACTLDRLSAIVVKSPIAPPYYYKKVRELASAEGAIMIWDEVGKDFNDASQQNIIAKNSKPDIFCFSNTDKIFIGISKKVMG